MVLCCEPHEITGLSMLSPTTAGEEGREEGEGGVESICNTRCYICCKIKYTMLKLHVKAYTAKNEQPVLA